MARVDNQEFFFNKTAITADESENAPQTVIPAAEHDVIAIPNVSFIRKADLTRDGQDLILNGPEEGSVRIEGYFSAAEAPDLVGPDGAILTPDLVQSFAKSILKYADAGSMSDESPVGSIQEISGTVTVTRLDGTVETGQIGLDIYQGDVIETDGEGAVNIVFTDETSFAISEDARLAIDEYVFDPSTNTGKTDFSVLNGVFVFTSGLIGREDPDDVNIETPIGSIGIRGTIIAGDVDAGEITVVEGAIVLRDFGGNEMTLANQFETAKFMPAENKIEYLGQMNANDVGQKFISVSSVSPGLFSSINDAAEESEEGGEAAEGVNDDRNTNNAGEDGSQKDSMLSEPEPAKMQTAGMEMNTGLKGPAPGTMASLQKAILEARGVSTEIIETRIARSENASSQQGNDNRPEVNDRPPFDIRFNFDLNPDDTILAKIKSTGSSFQALQLVGPSAQYLNLFQLPNGEYQVTLKSGALAAFIASGAKIEVEGISADGIQLTKAISVPTALLPLAGNTDTNSDPTFLDPVAGGLPQAIFAATEGLEWSYNFGRDFFDPNSGDTLTFALDPATQTALGALDTGYTFDTATGVLTLNIDPTLAADQTINIKVIATDTTGASTIGNYDFDAYDLQSLGTLAGSDLTTSDGVHAEKGTPETFYTISGNDNTVFFETNGNNTLTVNGNGNIVHTAGGDDAISLGATAQDNFVFGGAGNDTFNILGIQGNVFDGGSHADTTTAGERDVLKLLNGGVGTLDFTAIDNKFIKNIEELDINNTENNTVKLSYQDVVAMTDANNTLFIKTDATSDTVDLSGSGFVLDLSDTTQTGNGYNAYINGEVTLYIDADATVTLV